MYSDEKEKVREQSGKYKMKSDKSKKKVKSAKWQEKYKMKWKYLMEIVIGRMITNTWLPDSTKVIKKKDNFWTKSGQWGHSASGRNLFCIIMHAPRGR